MKIELRWDGLAADARLRAHVQERLEMALNRFQDRVQWARVWLKDINGPRGGDDKECLVLVRMKGGSDIVLQERELNALSAFDRAVGRVVQALKRQVGKRRRIGRQRFEMELLPA